MLDLGVFRAGGEEYAPGDDDEDGTFGLATLRREHVKLKRGAVLFSYPAKGGVPRAVALKDPLLHKMVNSLLRRHGGGEDLLVYRNGRRAWHDVRAADLNAAVKELAGEEYTCKDLRTWNATVLAAVTLAAGTAESGVPKSERTRKRVVNQAVEQVSEHLGNTPAVARSSYIDPRVLEQFGRAARCCPRCASWKARCPTSPTTPRAHRSNAPSSASSRPEQARVLHRRVSTCTPSRGCPPPNAASRRQVSTHRFSWISLASRSRL